MPSCDTALVGGHVAIAGAPPVRADIAIRGGIIVGIGTGVGADAHEVVDCSGLLILPGAVDAHFHIGIYRGFKEDARSETQSALVGGVTSVLSYFRTGHHYLDRTGPYAEILPELLAMAAGECWTDYGFHLAPMDNAHVAEIERLVAHDGITSFKYYMFYKGMNLAGDSRDSATYTMAENYDLGHLLEIMEAVVRAGQGSPTRVSLSIHCEQPELIRVFLERVRRDPRVSGLKAYSQARPPLTEQLAIAEAGVLASASRCPINLLHLSSADALSAARKLQRENPDLDVRLETTLHHLALAYETYSDQRGKVNPPIRSERDVAALWSGVLSGAIDWIVSDHACCSDEAKGGSLWSALPGFGGTALLYPFLLTEGLRRGLSLERVVQLASTKPAEAYGLRPRKGAIALGADADLACVDMTEHRTVTAALLQSAQDYTPFEGMSLTGWPVYTLLRGQLVYREGEVVGSPQGAFLARTTSS